MIKLTIVAGARPNFIKISPLIKAIKNHKSFGKTLFYRLVHTGQHYDKNMSDKFFEDLEIPHPDTNLNCQSGTQAEQTADIMVKFEKELIQNPADLVIVVGDVNSTMACSITAKKLNIKVAHIEAGIRSYDMSMPEEINRIVTDSITDYFFTTTPEASDLLIRNGLPKNKIFFVGNIMIDTLLQTTEKSKEPDFWIESELKNKKYFVLTLHRPSNVDESSSLMDIIKNICDYTFPFPIIFPIHPRTKKFYTPSILPDNLIMVEPLGYLEFNYLVKNSMGVITDSGGITEECTVLNIPCITLRENTERPETVTLGTNVIAGKDLKLIRQYIYQIKNNNWKTSQIPELWDGHTADRVVKILLDKLMI